ncbi:MAG: hypothetical protein ABJB16_04200, partial [Saprospiraceae bacterium]
MCFRKTSLTVFFLSLLTVLSFSSATSQQLSLKVAGDQQAGFHVDIYNGNQLVVSNTEEFTLQLFNLDMSTTALVQWTGQTWSGDEMSITLQRDGYLKEFDANLSASVTYQVVNPNLVKKTVELFQPSMPGMYYIMQETARPAQSPQRYITFEYDSFPGGLVHEMYPAAGFITPNHDVVGFLTDAGYKNQYTRNTRRRFSGRGGGFVGMRRLPDPNLFSVATLSDRAQDDDYIKQTFGEMYNLDACTTTVI